MGARAFRIRAIYHVLLSAYGPQGWWPAESPLETIVGAVLTQNTSWRNVEKALARLRARGALSSPSSLRCLSAAELEELISPAGFYRQKGSTLRRLLARADDAPGALAGVLSMDRTALRRWLLELKGIGPETADSIILYAAGRPAFVIDAYTRRIGARHGIAPRSAPYEELQRLFEVALPASARLMNEYHALLVRLGKSRCGPTPACSGCPVCWDLRRRRAGSRKRSHYPP
jgi:endonuclease-3 related protein